MNKYIPLFLLGVCSVFLSACSEKPAEEDVASATSVSESSSHVAEVASKPKVQGQSRIPVSDASEVIREVDTPEGKVYFARMATVVGVEENQKLQENLNFVIAQARKVVELEDAYETTVDPDKRAELKPKLEKAKEAFGEYNQKLIDLYQISLTRNYVVVPERSHLFVRASEGEFEEAQKRQQTQDAQ